MKFAVVLYFLSVIFSSFNVQFLNSKSWQAWNLFGTNGGKDGYNIPPKTDKSEYSKLSAQSWFLCG